MAKEHPKVWWENAENQIVGRCKKCENEVRAVGLIPIPDRMVFGRFKDGGWYCSNCKPREFGRVGGKPARAIPIAPIFLIVKE